MCSPNAPVDSEYCNGRWLSYTGAASITNGDWREWVHPADAAGVDEKWSRSFRDGDSFEVECRLRRGEDGAYRWFLCRALPLRDDSGKITRWFGTCTDVHEQRRAADGLSVPAEPSAMLASSVDIDAAMPGVPHLALPRPGRWLRGATAGPDIGDADLDSDSDRNGTGERGAVGRDSSTPVDVMFQGQDAATLESDDQPDIEVAATEGLVVDDEEDDDAR